MEVHLNYQLIRSKKRRKTLSLRVKEDGLIVVSVPHRTPEGEIERFLDKHQSWITKKIAEKEGRIRRPERSFLPDEKFLYLGEAYPLEISEVTKGGQPLTLSFGRFILSRDCIEKARDLFIAWYKKEAEARLAERVDYYSNRFQLFPNSLKITSANSRWGSCSRDNRLCISWRIMMAPLSVIDYILIHELVHIQEKNHSMKFWNCVASLLPDYKKERRWLRDHENLLHL